MTKSARRRDRPLLFQRYADLGYPLSVRRAAKLRDERHLLYRSLPANPTRPAVPHSPASMYRMPHRPAFGDMESPRNGLRVITRSREAPYTIRPTERRYGAARWPTEAP